MHGTRNNNKSVLNEVPRVPKCLECLSALQVLKELYAGIDLNIERETLL